MYVLTCIVQLLKLFMIYHFICIDIAIATPDSYLRALPTGMMVEGIYIRQTTSAHGITNM